MNNMTHTLNHEEQEELDKLKSIWQRYGGLMIVILVLAVGTAAGLQWWQQHQLSKASQAESLYAALQGMQQSGQTQAVTTLADALSTRYPDSAYAARGQLAAGSSDVVAHQIAPAIKAFQWVIDHSKEPGVRDIASLRLAGLQLDQHQAALALTILNTPHDEQYANLFDELKGDAYVMLNQREQARAAYRIALEKLPADSAYRQVIEIKLNAIAGVANK
ncbi:MAG: tetratricopeptide repeat protein [Betaproteobacteria bacterium]|nr:tetratricopeptide repeat protein [Betaproteobacteria bacterium]